MAEEWSVVPSRPKRPSQHNGSSLLEEKVVSARDTSTVSQQKRHNSSRASDQGAIPQRKDGTTFTSQQRSPKERRNEVPPRSESQSQTGQNTVHTTAICLMRRPVSHKPPQSELSTTSTSTSNTESQLTGKSSDDDIRDKIGAPIIRHSPRTGSSVDTLSRPQQRAVSDRDFNTGQYPAGNDGLRSSQYTSGQPISRMGHKMSRGGLLVLQVYTCTACTCIYFLHDNSVHVYMPTTCTFLFQNIVLYYPHISLNELNIQKDHTYTCTM